MAQAWADYQVKKAAQQRQRLREDMENARFEGLDRVAAALQRNYTKRRRVEIDP